jgi:hypothetical protein
MSDNVRAKVRSAIARHALSMLMLSLGAASMAAGTPSVSPASNVRPIYLSSYPALFPTYLYPGVCLPYGACAVAGWADRRPWRRPTAPHEAPVIEQDIWGTTGSPWGYVRRMPPPTPSSQIQPRYQEASTVRPEFRDP